MSKPKGDLKLVHSTESVQDTGVVDVGVATHAVVRESPVDVLYMIAAPQDMFIAAPQKMFDLRSDNNDRRYIRVKLYGKKRPELISYTDIFIKGKSKKEMARACEYAAAALAERMMILYGQENAYDPFYAAKSARRHYEELCDYIARAGS